MPLDCTMGGIQATIQQKETRSDAPSVTPHWPRKEDSASSPASSQAAGPSLTKWVARYRAEGADGLEDRSSAPAARPTRPRQQNSTGVQARAHAARRLHLPALGHRWVLPAGVHRSPRGRDSTDHDRVLRPGSRVLRHPWHHAPHPSRDGQRRELPGLTVRDGGAVARLASSAHAGVYAAAQREGRTLPATPCRRVPLCPRL